MSSDEPLAEQRAYYRARAHEYDEWWQRSGRFDRGAESTEEWSRQTALETFDAAGDVLEMAGGTGWWTQRLAGTAGHLTVVDSSHETLSLNRERVRRSDVDYLAVDLFTWQPTAIYDVVFFSFWLSHVPRSRFSDFWSLVGACLAPGGRVFFIDNRIDRKRLVRPTIPPSWDATPIWTGDASTTEASAKSSRCSTSQRSCRHF